MTDEELRKELRKIRMGQNAQFFFLTVTIMLLFAVQSCETRQLICSAENPPKACRE